MNDKIFEASYFIEQMRLNEVHHLAFKYNLSAYLSASRSIMQLLLDKGRGIQGFQAWYDFQMQDPLLRFFKKTRDASIHEGQLSLDALTQDGTAPRVNILKNVQGTYTMLASTYLDASKKIDSIVFIPQVGNIEYRANYCWSFSDYPDDFYKKNEVLELCKDYLQLVQSCATERKTLFGI